MKWRAGALLICLSVLAANAWHIHSQAAPPAWDDAWYLENSFRFYFTLKQGLLPFCLEYVQAFKTKAPLISLLPLPLYALFGPGERMALWANQFCMGLTLLFVYRIGKRLYGERAGLAGAAAAALIPLLYGLSRVFLVESLLTALVSCSAWALLEARPEDPRAGAKLGVLLGLGLLAKSVFPLYLLWPLWLRRKALAPHSGTALAVGGLIASTWYLFNAVYVLGFGLSAGFGRIAHDYGSASLAPAALSHYAASLGQDALSWPYLLAAGALALAAWRQRRNRGLGPAERFLLAWLLLPLGVFTLGVNKDIRYLAPALPALAVALGASAGSFSRTRWKTLLVLLLLLLPLGQLARQTFGFPPGPALAYNGPPSSDPGWDRSALVEAMAKTASENSVIAVGLEHRLLNANNLASLSASRGHPFRFISLGYAQASAEGALIRLKDKGADLLVMVEGKLPEDLPAFLNRANPGVQQAINRGRLPAKKLARIPIRDGLQAVLYRLKP